MSNMFDERYSQLNDEQRRAVDTIDGPLLVLAGPGTGKTELLSMRTANILRQTDTVPQNILCLTFTDAAAYNMRERLTSIIGEDAYDVQIFTYHSFASEIIKNYPDFFESIDLDTGKDSRMERPIDEIRQLEIIKDIVNKLPFSDPLRSARYYLKSVVGTISDFKQAALTPKDVAAIATQNMQTISELSSKINDAWQGSTTMPRKAEVAIALFGSIQETLSANTSNLSTSAQSQLAVAIEEAEALNTTKPLTAWKNSWLHKNEEDEWTFTDLLQAQKLLSISAIFAKYQEQLEASGQYDFNDMIMRTITALQQKPELKFNLQERYQYILLDEFQDTNAAQFKLVSLLADHPVHEGKPNVMAVGDDDQGIFAFQGADIGNMSSFLSTFRDVPIINLVKNYRSHHDILHIAHNVAEQIESRLHHNLDGVSKTIQASSDKLPEDATVARHEFESQANEFGWIAEQIKLLIKNGTKPSEIAVLAPKHAILESLVPFLNQNNIPVSYEKRENIFETPIISALLLMCEFLQSASEQNMTQSDALLPQVLSLDFWNIPTSTIWQLNWDFYSQKFKQYKPWAQLALSQKNTARPTEFMLKLALTAQTNSLEYTLDYLTGVKSLRLDDNTEYYSPFKQFYFSESAQKQSSLSFYEAISHLSVIRSHLRDQQAMQDSQLKIDDFLNMYQTYEEAQIPLLNTHPIAQSTESVQLQTVYKAKGLEYEYVFLPSMHDDIWGSSAKSSNTKISLPQNLQYIRHDGNSEDTRRRLLFVAITRAKHGLYCTSHAQKENGKNTMPVKYMRESEIESGRVSEVLPEHARTVIQTARFADDTQQDVQTLWFSREVLMQPKLKSLLSEQLNRYVMSPTHLNSFTNVEYAGPESFLLHTLLRFPEAPSPDSIYGDALHKALELYQKSDPDNAQALNNSVTLFTQRVTQSVLSETDKSIYTDRGVRALKKFIASQATRLHTPAQIEVDFRGEGVVLNGAVLTGKIDRLEVDQKNKSVRIIDFKSGSPSTKWSSSSKYLAYKQQLYFYMLLVEKSHTFKDYSVESAALEFIEPLQSGKVAPPLVLTYKNSEYQELKQLISAVWQKIQSLDLPDQSLYEQSAKGMRSFIADLLSKKV